MYFLIFMMIDFFVQSKYIMTIPLKTSEISRYSENFEIDFKHQLIDYQLFTMNTLQDITKTENSIFIAR
ncbi:hypothetical protein ATO12_10285 [Aquimarina atlantica]|uniref:Uncharacterized protein n=1 Tax=Aquimarina atlantica TaxID=1317122 RepID=A0A023BYM5_9FLAO|nr:hypothetical protein ATO12_10285 [Aquimarina atlantica]